jgi:hypothetical protein
MQQGLDALLNWSERSNAVYFLVKSNGTVPFESLDTETNVTAFEELKEFFENRAVDNSKYRILTKRRIKGKLENSVTEDFTLAALPVTSSIGNNENFYKEKYELMGIIQEMRKENEDLKFEAENPEKEEKPVTMQIFESLLPHSDAIIGYVLEKIGIMKPSLQIAGVNSDNNAEMLLKQMLDIEPQFGTHLKLLYNLRKSNPSMYAIALNQLENLV